MIYNSHNHNIWNKAVDHTDTSTSRAVFRSAFRGEYYGSSGLSRCTSTTLVWVSPISRTLSCDLPHHSLSTTAIMAYVLVVVPAVRGRPVFTPAVSFTRPVSQRRCTVVENHWHLNDVEQNNVVGTTALFAVFIACVFHDQSIETYPYHALGALCSLITRVIIVQTAQLRIWHLTVMCISKIYVSGHKGHYRLLFNNSDTMGSLWSTVFSPFINMLLKGVIQCTDDQLKTPYEYISDLVTLLLNIAMGEVLLVQ
jgi:hypothetical protein